MATYARGASSALERRPMLLRTQRLLLTLVVFMATAVSAVADTPYFETEAVKALAGRNVLLLVGPESATSSQKALYQDLLSRAGAKSAKYPVFTTSELPELVARRLGLADRQPGYGALVRWGNPARFGPSRVLEPGVITQLDSEADIFVLVAEAMAAEGQSSLLDKLPEDLQALRPKVELAIENVDFQANGKPLFVLNTKVRIKNSGKRNAYGVSVVYLVENPTDKTWFELGRHTGLKVLAGQTLTRDLVRNTHNTPLLDAQNAIQATKYRIVVESPDGRLEKTEEFQPQLIEDQD